MGDEDEHNARHRARVAISSLLLLLSLLLESSTFERYVPGNAKRRSELKEVLGDRRDEEELTCIDTFSIASMLTSVMADTVRRRDVEDTDSNVAIDFSIHN